jgi:hypothetical protein
VTADETWTVASIVIVYENVTAASTETDVVLSPSHPLYCLTRQWQLRYYSFLHHHHPVLIDWYDASDHDQGLKRVYVTNGVCLCHVFSMQG